MREHLESLDDYRRLVLAGETRGLRFAADQHRVTTNVAPRNLAMAGFHCLERRIPTAWSNDFQFFEIGRKDEEEAAAPGTAQEPLRSACSGCSRPPTRLHCLDLNSYMLRWPVHNFI